MTAQQQACYWTGKTHVHATYPFPGSLGQAPKGGQGLDCTILCYLACMLDNFLIAFGQLYSIGICS